MPSPSEVPLKMGAQGSDLNRMVSPAAGPPAQPGQHAGHTDHACATAGCATRGATTTRGRDREAKDRREGAPGRRRTHSDCRTTSNATPDTPTPRKPQGKGTPSTAPRSVVQHRSSPVAAHPPQASPDAGCCPQQSRQTTGDGERRTSRPSLGAACARTQCLRNSDLPAHNMESAFFTPGRPRRQGAQEQGGDRWPQEPPTNSGIGTTPDGGTPDARHSGAPHDTGARCSEPVRLGGGVRRRGARAEEKTKQRTDQGGRQSSPSNGDPPDVGHYRPAPVGGTSPTHHLAVDRPAQRRSTHSGHRSSHETAVPHTTAAAECERRRAEKLMTAQCRRTDRRRGVYMLPFSKRHGLARRSDAPDKVSRAVVDEDGSEETQSAEAGVRAMDVERAVSELRPAARRPRRARPTGDEVFNQRVQIRWPAHSTTSGRPSGTARGGRKDAGGERWARGDVEIDSARARCERAGGCQRAQDVNLQHVHKSTHTFVELKNAERLYISMGPQELGIWTRRIGRKHTGMMAMRRRTRSARSVGLRRGTHEPLVAVPHTDTAVARSGRGVLVALGRARSSGLETRASTSNRASAVGRTHGGGRPSATRPPAEARTRGEPTGAIGSWGSAVAMTSSNLQLTGSAEEQRQDVAEERQRWPRLEGAFFYHVLCVTALCVCVCDVPCTQRMMARTHLSARV